MASSPADGHDELALDHREQLPCASDVRLARVRITRAERPVPELHHVGCRDAGQENGSAAVLAGPERLALAGTNHLDPGSALAGRNELRQPDPERLAQTEQRRDAGVRAPLLHVDQHPAADA